MYVQDAGGREAKDNASNSIWRDATQKLYIRMCCEGMKRKENNLNVCLDQTPNPYSNSLLFDFPNPLSNLISNYTPSTSRQQAISQSANWYVMVDQPVTLG